MSTSLNHRRTTGRQTVLAWVTLLLALGGCGGGSYAGGGGGGGLAPTTPMGLAAMAGDTQVGLLWTASSGATSYHVKRSSTSGGSPFTCRAALIPAINP